MKKLLEYKLKILAKAVLNKYRPEIVGITGSVGKTSARGAVYAVLAPYFNVRESIKNYNNEIGVPLTIIGAPAGGKSVFGWLAVFWRVLKLILFKNRNYPKILILEMGVDRPGDMAYLLGIVKPKIAVLTKIGESHLEFFSSVDEIKKEKGLLFGNLPESGYAILNFDDERIRELRGGIKAKIITYGFDKQADVRAEEVKAVSGDEFQPAQIASFGISFKLMYGSALEPVYLPRVLGKPAVEAGLAGAAVGIISGLNLKQISQALRNFKPPKGRMNLIAGIKNTLIIDDTYNSSSPQSSFVALEAIGEINLSAKGRKIAVLGDMLELGSFTEEGHRKVGQKAAESGVDELVVVGERARDIARGAIASGMDEKNIFYFPHADDARLFVQQRIKEGDFVLIKGSQGARMEKIVKEIMAEPLKAKELLVRQEKEWE